MKKKFLALLLCAAPALVSAQNILTSAAFDFEPKNGKAGGYNWIAAAQREHLQVTNEKAAKGEYSLKFDSRSLGEKDKLTAFASVLDSIDEGTYTLKAKVFVVEGDMRNANLALIGSEYQSIGIPLKNATPGEWVEVSETKTLKASTKVSTNISVTGHSKWGCKGIFYIDDIRLIKE